MARTAYIGVDESYCPGNGPRIIVATMSFSPEDGKEKWQAARTRRNNWIDSWLQNQDVDYRYAIETGIYPNYNAHIVYTYFLVRNLIDGRKIKNVVIGLDGKFSNELLDFLRGKFNDVNTEIKCYPKKNSKVFLYTDCIYAADSLATILFRRYRDRELRFDDEKMTKITWDEIAEMQREYMGKTARPRAGINRGLARARKEEREKLRSKVYKGGFMLP